VVTKKEVDKFIKNQKSIHLYKKVQKALRDVLLAMSDEDYRKVTKNLILMVVHETSYGQLMYHSPVKSKFKILQLSVAKDIDINILRWIIAHELGHATQGRNWRRGDDEKLEKDADKKAEKWGFKKTKAIQKYGDKEYTGIKKLYKRINKK